MSYGANAAVDAICHGLEAHVAANDAELRVAYADFADPDGNTWVLQEVDRSRA